MAPIQRRRGIPATVWRVEKQTDNRGNVHKIAVPDVNEVVVWMIPLRGSRAEVPGQQPINVIRVGVPGHFTDVDLWTRVEMMGREWDAISPPSYHHGTRHTRHWTLELRERPNVSGGDR